MLEFIARHDSTINGLLVLRDESVVLESYRCPYRAETLHHLYSATKSLVSALIGIAINDGCIRDVDQPIVDLLPAHARPLRDPRTRAITVRHALTMTTGLDWAEARSSYANPRNPVQEMQRAPDWVRYVLDRRVVAAPGEQLNYNSGASHLLAAALQSSTGMSVASFAEVPALSTARHLGFLLDVRPTGHQHGRLGTPPSAAGHGEVRRVVSECRPLEGQGGRSGALDSGIDPTLREDRAQASPTRPLARAITPPAGVRGWQAPGVDRLRLPLVDP